MFFSLKRITFFCLCFFISILKYYDSATLDANLISDAVYSSLGGIENTGTNMHTCKAAGCASFKNIIKDNSDDCLNGFICKKCKKTHAKSPNICFYSSLEGYESLYEGLLEDFNETAYDTFNIPLNKKSKKEKGKNETEQEQKKTDDKKEKEEKKEKGEEDEEEEEEKEEKEEDEKKDTSKKNKKGKSDSKKKGEEVEDHEEEGEGEGEEEDDEDDETKKDSEESKKKKNKSNSKNKEGESFLERSTKNAYVNSILWGKKNEIHNRFQLKKKSTTYATSIEPDGDYNVSEGTTYSLLEENKEEQKIIHRRLKININKYEEYLKNKLKKCYISDDGVASIYIKLIFQIVKDKEDIYIDESKKSITGSRGESTVQSKNSEDVDEEGDENEDGEEKGKNKYDDDDDDYYSKKEPSSKHSHFSNSYESNDNTTYGHINNSQENSHFDYNSRYNQNNSNPALNPYNYIELQKLKVENYNFSTKENNSNNINEHLKIEKTNIYKKLDNKSIKPHETEKKEKVYNNMKNNLPNNVAYTFYQYKVGDDLEGNSMENYYKSKNGFFKSIFKKVFKKKDDSDGEDDDYDEPKKKKKGGFFSRKNNKKGKKNEDDESDNGNDELNDNNENEEDDVDNDISPSHSGRSSSKEKSKDKKKHKKKSLFSKFKSKYFPKKQKLHIEAYFNNIIVKTCKDSLKWEGKMFRKHSLIEMTLKVPVKMKYIEDEPLKFFRSGYEVILTCKNCDKVLFNSCVQIYCKKKNNKNADDTVGTSYNSSDANLMSTPAFAPFPMYDYGYQNPSDIYFMPSSYYSNGNNFYMKYSIAFLIILITLLI